MSQLQLGVFASGRGSNFTAILKAIDDGRLDAVVRVLVSNNDDAGALETAQDRGIPTAVIRRKGFPSRDEFIEAHIDVLKNHGVDFVVLAGYMKMIPEAVIQQYRHRIVNIHPALLPSFGGKGMYGHFVHEAVLARGCKVSGVTIHIVDEIYDNGPIVTQRCIPVEAADTPDTLAARVLKTEHILYAETLQLFAEERVEIRDGLAAIR